MKFDMILYTAADLATAFAGEGDMICIEGLTRDELSTLLPILAKREASICVLPWRE